MKYEAVDKSTLIKRTHGNCSPMLGRDGYVIGPDINGRLCHIATCFTLGEAKQRAAKLNERQE